MKKNLLLFVSLMFFSYLIGAFCAWDFDPRVWGAGGRAIWATIFIPVSVAISFL